MPGIGGALKQTAADVGEAVAKPVKDEVGKAIEEGVQSVIRGTQAKLPDPLEQKKKQEEELKKKRWAMRVIEWNKQLDEAQKKVRQENQQKITQQKQEEDEKKKVKQFKVMEGQKKKQDFSQAQLAERRAEIKRGVGG